MMTVGSLFSGIGGFDLGFERAGFDVRWQVEIEPHAQDVLRAHWPNAALYSDVCEVGAHNLEPVDIITFGSPCQDLSVAGKRAGLDGKRSGLYFEAIRIITDLRPGFAIWENVPGAFSSNNGRDFASALDALAECGAMDIAWRVLDAQYFGVAQRRRRVFVIADFRGERAGQILVEPEGMSGNTPPCRETRQDVAGTLGGGTGTRGWAPDTDRMTFVARALTSRNQRIDAETETFITHALTAEGHDASEDGTGRGTPGQGYPAVAIPFDPRQIHHPANRSNPKPGDPCHPLRSVGNAEPAIVQAMTVRRLTPRECERLQGFPDDWTAGHSDSARYRMLGNAVCVPVAEWIAKRIMAVIQ